MALNSKCAALDTNIIVRLLVRDNPEQATLARDLILNGDDYYVDAFVVAESVFVLEKYYYEREEIVDFLQTLLSNNMFIYDKTFFNDVFDRYASRPSLSFYDCILEARAKLKNSLPLWTFDRKFANQSEAARLLTY